MKPEITIIYCTQCKWLLRAGWMAQELLQTFETEIAGVKLQPGTGGIYEVWIDAEQVFSFKTSRRFPQPKELKRLIRDIIAPEKDLGHNDRGI
ncbi:MULTISPECIES: SelT/SelW/SelH family protein [Persicobacter]|uniref:Selenoprotein W-related protein n=1 Tax=Persicobacter diffluens TaxID=981 RepID=A0AAN4VVP9_9BACT|nr:SelT/SelW/SelH family protein [Persicobacter sp. CCB-QB2]GJM60277.1 hypothetical protein PEDI_08290 [Persicobacter diffluens]